MILNTRHGPWLVFILPYKPHSVCQHPLLHIQASSHLFRCSTFYRNWKALCPSSLICWQLSTSKVCTLSSNSWPFPLIQSWMTLNKFKLNDNKTEAMVVSSGWKSRSLSFSFPYFVTVGCASVPLSDSVKSLGITLDCHLTMKTHVSNLVRAANF